MSTRVSNPVISLLSMLKGKCMVSLTTRRQTGSSTLSGLGDWKPSKLCAHAKSCCQQLHRIFYSNCPRTCMCRWQLMMLLHNIPIKLRLKYADHHVHMHRHLVNKALRETSRPGPSWRSFLAEIQAIYCIAIRVANSW